MEWNLLLKYFHANFNENVEKIFQKPVQTFILLFPNSDEEELYSKVWEAKLYCFQEKAERMNWRTNIFHGFVANYQIGFLLNHFRLCYCGDLKIHLSK